MLNIKSKKQYTKNKKNNPKKNRLKTNFTLTKTTNYSMMMHDVDDTRTLSIETTAAGLP